MPLWAWIVFYALVLLMLALDLKMFGRKGQHEVGVKEALQMTGVWIGVSMLFAVGIYFFYPVQPHEKAMEFLAGYLIEKSLSMDNLFVFLMLFSFFGVERKYQHEVLFWGILGALVLRSIFIFAGAAMVERFDWVLGLFGLFLLYTGFKMFSHNDEQQVNLADNILIRVFKRFFPVTRQMHGEKFFVREYGVTLATPLFVALLVIGTIDVAFAVDSIPAVFSVSHDPFIVLTSNIFTILGLRALYFALAAIAQYFKYLKYGLGIILMFVGVKMLLGMNDYINALASYVGIELNMPRIEIPIMVSLSVIIGLLMASMLLSYLNTDKLAEVSARTNEGSDKSDEALAKTKENADKVADVSARANAGSEKRADDSERKNELRFEVADGSAKRNAMRFEVAERSARGNEVRLGLADTSARKNENSFVFADMSASEK